MIVVFVPSLFFLTEKDFVICECIICLKKLISFTTGSKPKFSNSLSLELTNCPRFLIFPNLINQKKTAFEISKIYTINV